MKTLARGLGTKVIVGVVSTWERERKKNKLVAWRKLVENLFQQKMAEELEMATKKVVLAALAKLKELKLKNFY